MVTLTKPEDYQIPEGVEEGEEFDEIATFKVDEDGKLQMLALDGNKLEEDKSTKKKKPKGAIQKSEEDFDPAAQSGT